MKMKKKCLLILCMALAVCLLSSCTMLPASMLDVMFRGNNSTSAGSGNSTGDGDTVTISREEYEQYRQFDELLELMASADVYFYQEPDHEKMLQEAAAGLLRGLEDDYTFYYNPEEWEKLWEEDEGEYTGIGVLISSNYVTGICTISRVFKGSPAEKAGVQRGDILFKGNDDLFVTAENLQEAVDIMRGTPGTTVDVTFLRNGEEITFTILRETIEVNQIEYTLLENDIGLIAYYEFAGHSDEEFEAAMNDLIAQGAKGLIVDLRDNPGGWVDHAQNVADLFVDAGDLCYLVYRDGTEDHCYPTKDGKTDIPLVMLVNENTASSSEILTACLRERADATVVGVNTYGKGIVQAVMGIGQDAGYQMTIAQYFTPEGNAVHKIGIHPDVEIPLEEGDNGAYDFADTENDPQLKKALEVMMEKLR